MIVGEVLSGSPADETGLRAGDRIAAIDGKPLGNLRPFFEAIVVGRKNVVELTVELPSSAGRVFREARIEIQWRSCPEALEGKEAQQSKNCTEAVFPKHLHLRIARRSIGLSPDTMGISFLSKDGTGCQADLFYEEMEGLRQRGKADMASILGHVAAHEIGHLLLGTNSHTSQGIMRSVWGHDELVSGSRRALFFSEKQSMQMRARLAMFRALAEDRRKLEPDY